MQNRLTPEEELAEISVAVTDDSSDEDVPKSAAKAKRGRPRSKTPPKQQQQQQAPAPPPIQMPSQTEMKKAMKEAEKEEKEKRRLTKYSDLMQYFHSPILNKYTEGINPPTPHTTEEQIDAIKATIKQNMAGRHKRIWVDRMYVGVSGLMEMGLVDLAKSPDGVGLQDCLIQCMPQFDEDLEEISMDVPDRLIPSAKFRLLFGMVMVVQEFIKAKKSSNPAPDTQTN